MEQSRKTISHQDTSGAGAEYEQFLARTKTLQQASPSWSVAGLEKALNNIGCLNSVRHISFSFVCCLRIQGCPSSACTKEDLPARTATGRAFPGRLPADAGGRAAGRGDAVPRPGHVYHVTLLMTRATCDCRCGVCWRTCCSAPWRAARATGTG